MRDTELVIAFCERRCAELGPYSPAAVAAFQEVVTYVRQVQSESVSVQEAALLTGYTADALGRMLARGDLQNVGNKRRPRVRRMDLPAKPGYRRRAASTDFDPAALACKATR